MTSRQPVAQGGLFGASTQAPLSDQTKELLKVMMEESKLSNFQRRKLNETVKKGNSLPIRVAPTSSERKYQAPSVSTNQKVYTMVGQRPSSMRSRDEIEESGAYDRPQFIPKPIRSLEKEKDRLSNMMAYGEDVKPKTHQQLMKEKRAKEKDSIPVDRFDEIQSEIKERKEFLETMERVGEGKKYRPIISSQISLLIREMEVIDKKRTAQLMDALVEIEEKNDT